MTEREFAIEVVSKLQREGFQALFAGGCVRDELLGLTPADHDIATSATPDQVKALFRRTHSFGASFGVVEVLGPKDVNGEWLKVQVATFRSDGTYTDGRRPDSVTFSSPEEDAARRDFTINGLFFDPVAKRVSDFVGGETDLKAKVLRAIGDPHLRFAEDKLRILRAVRMAARFELTIDPATFAAAKEMAPQIRAVSAERIAEELRKILTNTHRMRGVELLHELGLFALILPEVDSTVVQIDPPPGSVATLPEPTSPSRGEVEEGGLLPPPPLRGRSSTPQVLAGGGSSESQLESVSFELAFTALLRGVTPKAATAICRRMRLSNDELDRIVWLVAHRTALTDAANRPNSTLYPILVHPGIEELLALHRADGHTADADHCEQILRTTPPEVLNPPPLLTGDDLKEMDLKPGPTFKKLLDELRTLQLDGKLSSRSEAEEKVHELLRVSPK